MADEEAHRLRLQELEALDDKRMLEKYRFGFWSFIYTYILTKTILELNVKNIDISSYICNGSYPYTLSFKSV